MKRVITIALLVIASASVTWAISLEEFVTKLGKVENVEVKDGEITPEMMKKYPGIEAASWYTFKGGAASVMSLLGGVDKKYNVRHEENEEKETSATWLVDRDSNPAMVVTVMRLANDGFVLVCKGAPDMVSLFNIEESK